MFLSLNIFVENLKIFCVGNFLDSRKRFCRKVPWSSKMFLWKNPLIMENFFWLWKIPWSRKISLTVKKFLDQRNFPWLSKTYFLDCRKKTALVILKRIASTDTIKAFILSLEQGLSSFTFFAVNKINIIFSRRQTLNL